MPPANRAGDQFDTLVVVRHKPVLEDSLKPSRLCRVSGRNGGQSSADQPLPNLLNLVAAPDCPRGRSGTAVGRTTSSRSNDGRIAGGEQPSRDGPAPLTPTALGPLRGVLLGGVAPI